MMISIKQQVSNLPQKPGIYKYYGAEEKILYIGKAKNLKKRVASYFTEKRSTSARLKLLVKKIEKIEYTIVDSEKDALLLENSLIKQHQPKYNIQLKDDKSFPYIVILNEAFPRIFLTRRIKDDGSYYFGPYTSVKRVRSILNLIKKIYPIRSCSLNLAEKHLKKEKYKVCLEYHIGNCLGPCELKQNVNDYNNNIAQIKEILKGKVTVVKKELRRQLEEQVERLEFEKADFTKKKLDSLSEYIASSTVVNPNLGNLHVFGYTENKNKSYISYLRIVDGTIIKTNGLVVTAKLEETKEEMLLYAVSHFVDDIDDTKLCIVPFELNSELTNNYINYAVPKIGDKKKLLDLALSNAMQLRNKHTSYKLGNNKERLLQQIKEDLQLKQLPFHIECFDNSNMQGSNPVASMVVFKNGKPSNKDYRHYHIKTVIGPDDFASMKEVVYRRYRTLKEEKQTFPQLIVIDGGKGQLNAAYEALQELKLHKEIQLISIAKRLEELYFPGDKYPIHLSKKSETLRVLQQLRNEAHRFAITFHRNLRSKNTFKTELTDIPGIGKVLAEKLLIHFKSVKGVISANPNELIAVLGNKKAQQLLHYFEGEKK